MNFTTGTKKEGEVTSSENNAFGRINQNSSDERNDQSHNSQRNNDLNIGGVVHIRGVDSENGDDEEKREDFYMTNVHMVNEKEALKVNGEMSDHLVNSHHAKPENTFNYPNSKLGISADKKGRDFRGSTYSNPSNLNNSMYASMGQNNLEPRYGNEGSSKNYGQNSSHSYKFKNIGLSEKMINSSISRESDGQGGNQRIMNLNPYTASSKGSSDHNLESSKHRLTASGIELMTRSKIEISHLMSENTVAELNRIIDNQKNRIRNLEGEQEELRSMRQKWEDGSCKDQIEIEAKGRQIEDLERKEKRLNEEIEILRSYRTMETVEQVVINNLQTEIMELNRKIVSMQAEHYRKEKMLMDKYGKGAFIETQANEQETISQLHINLDTEKKRVELINEELTKEKEKSWKLVREKEEFIAEKTILKDSLERELKNANKDIEVLKQEVHKYLEAVKMKDVKIEETKRHHQSEIQKLNETKKTFEAEISKIKSEFAQQTQNKQQQNNDKMIQEQKKIIQEQTEKKIKEQKVEFDAEISRKNKQIIELETNFQQKLENERKTFNVELQTKLSQQEQQLKVSSSSQADFDKIRVEKQALEQKVSQISVDLARANEGLNMWKAKAESTSVIEKERNELIIKVRNIEQQQNQNDLKDKYETLLIESEQTKHKLKLKEDEIQSFAKIRQYYNLDENKNGNLSKEIKVLETKLIDTQSQFKNILVKVQQEENKYNELYNKLVEDSAVYLAFIKKLQDENEEIVQKCNKMKKLCRTNKVKFNDEEPQTKESYAILKQYIEREVVSRITKVLIPEFQAKLQQRVSAVETDLTAKYKKILQLKHIVQTMKQKRLVQKK